MHNFPKIPPQLFTLSAVVVGFLLVDDSTPNEQNALGNWLMLVSQYLCTNAAYGQLLNSNNNNSQQSMPSNEETIKMLKKMVDALNEEINEIKKNINIYKDK